MYAENEKVNERWLKLTQLRYPNTDGSSKVSKKIRQVKKTFTGSKAIRGSRLHREKMGTVSLTQQSLKTLTDLMSANTDVQ